MCQTTTEKTDKNAERLAELVTVLGGKAGAAAHRLNALGLADTCGRCGGGGQYSYCQMYGTRCFGCGGLGYKMPKRVTAALVAAARERVAAGGLVEYLAALAARALAKKQAEGLLAEYSAACHESDAAVAAAGLAKKSWTITTERGSAIQAAMSGFYDRATKASGEMRHGQTDEQRTRAAVEFTRWRAEMLAAVERFVPAGLSLDVVDIDGRRAPEPTGGRDAYYARQESIRRAASGRILDVERELNAARA